MDDRNEREQADSQTQLILDALARLEQAEAMRMQGIEARLAQIEEHLRNLDTLAERRERDRKRKRNAYQNEKILRGEQNSPRNKENEKGKERFPPAPPIEKREEQEKAASAAAARVCAYTCAGACESTCACEDEATAKKPKTEFGFGPTFEQVEKFATLEGISANFTKQWFDQCDRVLRWLHPKTGTRIHSWQRYLQLCWKRRDEFDPIPEPATEEKPFLSKAMAAIMGRK